MKFVLSLVFMAVILFALVSADAPEVENGAMDFPGIARESCAGPSEKCKDLECCEPENTDACVTSEMMILAHAKGRNWLDRAKD
uniref:U27-Sparatoxin-Hju1f_1 n=1 Tax=Heteropoda jugulans TaxID=1358901 RepID=A0A4Q8KDY5_9ARAC